MILEWVISATSLPADDDEPAWVDQFIGHLNKRAEDGGTKSQPESTEEMVKLMVNYCVGSYERPPAKDAADNDVSHTNTEELHWRQKLSIRQIFSNYINVLVRNPLSTLLNYG